MKKYMVGLYSFGWRAGFVWAVLQLIQTAHAGGGFVSIIKRYPDEGIVIVCLLALVGGIFVATTYDLPNSATKEMSRAKKAGYAFIGGIVAFIYMITKQESLYLAQSIGVLSVAATSPALIHILYTLVVEKVVSVVRAIFGLKDDSGV